MSQPFTNIIQQEQQKLNTVVPSAVGSNCLLWTVVSLVTILAFNLLRPRNKIVYEPKVKYHVGDKPPPQISDGFFSWLPPLIHTKEPELLDKVGLDSTTFLRFLRMMRWMFTAITLLGCVMLIPTNVTYNMANVAAKDRDALSILTIRDVQGPVLFVHVAATYLFTIFVMVLVWVNWKQMVRLRQEWFASDEYQLSFYARTLMVLDVPKQLQSDEGLKSLFQSLQIPYPTTAVHIGRRVGKLPELVEYHNDAVKELETYLVRYLKGGQIGPKRPVITQGATLGCGGEKKDAIDFYTNKLKKTEQAIEQWRNDIDLKKPENYGFASMAAVPYASIVAKIMQNKHPKGTTITLAPNPKDLIWKNLSLTKAARLHKRTIGFAWLTLFCFFNTIPVFFISALANLASIASFVAPIGAWASASPWSFSLISALLPPSIAALFGYFLPVVMRWLSKYQGDVTRTRLDRAVVARYFAFLVISQLFIFSLIGVAFNCVKEIAVEVGKHVSFVDILNNLHTLPNTIHQTYINQANYWLTFFPLRGFLVVFDLAQVIKLVWTAIKTRVFGRTPRDIREWTKPPDFEYAIYYANLLFMAAVGLVFAPLAPLVAVAAAVVFWISSVVYKYQLMFVFVTKVESGGRLWNVAVNRLLFATILMQLLMVLTIGLREGFKSYQWVATIPPIFMIIIFKFVANRTFLSEFRYYIPNESQIRQSQIHSQSADNQGHRLEKRFGHPALHAELFTPMLHAKMVHLLPQVYHGNLGHEVTSVDEYRGKKLEAQVLPGGIKIAGVEQRDLEYDPKLYARDRGELDWDRRSSHSSTHLLGDMPSIAHSIAHSKISLPTERFQNYLAHGPGQRDIELARLDSRGDSLPLLSYGDGNVSAHPDRFASGDVSTYPLHEQEQSFTSPQLGYAESTYSLPSHYSRGSFYPPVTSSTPPPASRQQYYPPESQSRPQGQQQPQPMETHSYGGDPSRRTPQQSYYSPPPQDPLPRAGTPQRQAERQASYDPYYQSNIAGRGAYRGPYGSQG